MLSSSVRQVSSRTTRLVVARAMSSSVVAKDAKMPSIKDSIISLTFVDPSGARRKVPGMVGHTLWDTAQVHEIDLGPASVGAPVQAKRSDTWTEDLYGEGPTSGFDMVLLTGNGTETLPAKSHLEQRMMEHYWDPDELYPESRLACVIPLTKEMEGMTVFVPDRLVDDIP